MTYLRIILTAIIALVAMPFVASASTIVLTPTSVSVTPGQTFTVTVTAVPTSGTKLYTVKADLSFDPSIVQETNFSFAQGWIPLTQKGYDSTDNTNGNVMKTGGYPGGISSATVLGTATFAATKAGTATISVTSTSAAYDSTSNNTISGTQGAASVAVAAPAPTPTPKPVPAPAPAPKSTSNTKTASTHVAVAPKIGSQLAQVVGTTATNTATTTATTTPATTTVTTATPTVPQALRDDNDSGHIWIWIVVGVVIVLGLIWAIRRKPQQ